MVSFGCWEERRSVKIVETEGTDMSEISDELDK